MTTMEEEDYNQKVHQPDQDEEEETLSFCDLQICSNGADDYSVSAASSSSLDDSEMDMFEFLSRDTSIGFSEKSIIFCGKLITYKESEQSDETETTREEEKTSKRRRWSLFRPKSKSSVNSIKSVDRESRFASNSIYRTTLNSGKSDAPRNQPSSTTKKSGFSNHKPSVRSRSRWNLIMFGSLKFSSAVEMKLSDMRSRQKRRNPARAGGIILATERGEEKTKTVNELWSLIRSLGCNGGMAVSAVAPGSGFLY